LFGVLSGAVNVGVSVGPHDALHRDLKASCLVPGYVAHVAAGILVIDWSMY